MKNLIFLTSIFLSSGHRPRDQTGSEMVWPGSLSADFGVRPSVQ